MKETRELSGFELIEKLGEGGMASVWKARQISLDRQVAIKFLSSRMATDPADVQRFKAEAQSAAKLKHPGIVQVYDASFEGGVYSFVMEYVAGYTVGDWLLRKGQLSQDDILQVADCVADALGYAWDKERIIHCDIKPDNVMVDSDGTVKVMDLGLARTISNIAGEGVSDEVLGTPAYMAPEQAMGEAGLDFRTDIYALGAMMYHLSTGQIPFQGESEQSVMEKQITGTLKNPYDINHAMSKWFCQLIEVMMAKDKVNRYASWDEVRTDFARVKRGLPPHRKVAENAVSTIARSERLMEEHSRMRTHHAGSTATAPVQAAGRFPWKPAAILAAAAAIIAAAYFIMFRPPARSAGLPSPAVPDAAQPSVPAAEDPEDLFRLARAWSARNTDKPAEAMERFRRLAEKYPGTECARKSMAEIDALKVEVRNRAIKMAFAALKTQSDNLVAAAKYEDAIRAVEQYSGEWSSETSEDRAKLAGSIRNKFAEITAEQQRLANEAAAGKCKELIAKTVNLLLSAKYDDAHGAIDREISASTLGDRAAEFSELSKVILDVIKIDQSILDSYRKEKDQEVTIQLASGVQRKMKIISVDGDIITGWQAVTVGRSVATATISISLKDIAVSERLARMGSDNQPHVALIKGVMAYHVRNVPVARKYFEKTHSLIAGPLMQALGESAGKMLEMDAANELARLMAAAGAAGQSAEFNADEWLRAVQTAKPAADTVRRMADEVRKYREKFAGTEFAAKAADVLNALSSMVPGGSDIPRTAVVLEPGVWEEPENVADHFVRKNPDVRDYEIRFRRRDDGKVKEISINSSKLIDLSPVAAFRGLRSLECIARRDAAPLSDISALAGLPIEELALSNCRISNFTVVKSLPNLRSLALTSMDIKDISFLRGLPLQSLDLSRTKVYDFSVLSGMPLRSLRLNDTQVKSYIFMQNMPLQCLELGGSPMYEFTFLANLPLQELSLARTQIRSLEPLRRLFLRRLSLSETKVVEISILSNMPSLESLDLSGTAIKDFRPIKGLSLRNLELRNTSFEDPGLLAGMVLRHLDIRDTKVKTLQGLNLSEINSLDISNTQIADMTPLKGTPITRLNCRGCAVDNMWVLADSRLEYLTVDNPSRWQDLFNRMPEIKEVNGINPKLGNL
jgi:eukaryotic-like serine/threonine-protein kinase